MQSSQWPSCFESVPKRLLFLCMAQRRENPTGKEIFKLVKERIKIENQELIKLDASFKADYKAGETEDTVSSIKIFQRIMIRLHGLAVELDCDISPPEGTTPENRLEWEWDNHEKLASRVIAAKLSREFKEIQEKQWKEMIKELEKYDNSASTKRAIGSLETIEELIINKEKILNLCKLTNNPLIQLSNGWVVRNDPEQIKLIALSAKTIILRAYQPCKKESNLRPFIEVILNTGQFCIEAILSDLQFFIVMKENNQESLNSVSDINPLETKNNNFYKLFQAFKSDQWTKFLNDGNDLRDLYHKHSTFKRDYYNKENFIAFLTEKNIVGQMTSGGKITFDDIQEYIKNQTSLN